MQMIKEDNTTIYFVIAVIFHSLFIVSINPFSVIKDVAVIGESGMNVQMILIQKGDENFDKAIMSENKRNELDDAEKDQEVILDDRKVGDISKNAYQSYYGQIRKIIDSNKKYPLLARQRREEGSTSKYTPCAHCIANKIVFYCEIIDSVKTLINAISHK